MIVKKANMDWETVHMILTEKLGMIQICSEMIPKIITEQQQDEWRNVMSNLLEQVELNS